MDYSYIPHDTYTTIVANIIVRETTLHNINAELRYLPLPLEQIRRIVEDYRFTICQERNYLESLLKEG